MDNNKENITIGIPRAVSYYNNYPFYFGFLTELGVKIVLSDKTTNTLINNGCKCVVSDTCLPVKVFLGHVLNLLEKGVNTIFVPSIQSTGYKINNCSKIRGLPEIIRNVVKTPVNIIEPVLDKTEGKGIKSFCYEFAMALGITDKNLIDSAIKKGWETYNNFLIMAKYGTGYKEALDNAIENKMKLKNTEIAKPVSVAIMGHEYNLFDERISMNLIKKLEKMNVKVYTSLNISREDAIKSINEIGEMQYWANELELTGTAAYYMLNKKVDGIIALSAFGCGPDSLMIDEMLSHAKEMNMPVITLTIDEHTGEAGFMTRVEAFADMLIRKKREIIKQKAKLKMISSQKNKSTTEKTLVNTAS